MTEQKKRERKRNITALVCLLAADIVLWLTLWLLSYYDEIRPDQILYQLKTSASGTSSSVASVGVLIVGFGALGLLAVQMGIYTLLSGRWQRLRGCLQSYRDYCTHGVCSFFCRRALPLAATMLCLSAMVFFTSVNAFAYMGSLIEESDFIEDHVADPEKVQLTFPEQKRNLIYIYLESMENTYTDAALGGAMAENYIPELSALAQENVSFSHTDSALGGALSYTGTTWTAAAMVAQTSGMTVKVPLAGEELGGEEEYMPGTTALGDILHRQGYRQVLLLGSDAGFANRKDYFTEHGNYTIIDLMELRDMGILPEDYFEWWGYEDEKLFAYAKTVLRKLGATGQPFNFTTLTADTHFPDGYVCELCGEEYDNQYANVLSCSSRQVYEFIRWIQEQPFYENTTIILSGDHTTMDPEFLAELDENYIRTMYNCIINPAAEPVQTQNRQFGVFDMFPTTLAAMGVEIEGDRLGLGTNLFSALPTLTEEYGYDFLDDELQKRSEYYNEEIYEEG